MTSPLCVATGGWCRRVFHYRPPTPMYRNSPPLCTIVLQIPSLMPLKMRKVQLGGAVLPRLRHTGDTPGGDGASAPCMLAVQHRLLPQTVLGHLQEYCISLVLLPDHGGGLCVARQCGVKEFPPCGPVPAASASPPASCPMENPPICNGWCASRRPGPHRFAAVQSYGWRPWIVVR